MVLALALEAPPARPPEELRDDAAASVIELFAYAEPGSVASDGEPAAGREVKDEPEPAALPAGRVALAPDAPIDPTARVEPPATGAQPVANDPTRVDRPGPSETAAPSASPAPAIAATASASGSEYAGPAAAMPLLTASPLAGVPLWTVPGTLPETAPPPPAPTTSPRPTAPPRDIATRLVQDSMRDHDRKLGLGNPGATAASSAVSAAVLASRAPVDSEASFAVSLGPDGAVLAVRAEGFRGGDSALWNGIAKSVAAQLAGQKLRVAGNDHGAVVRISMRSALTAVSGGPGRSLGPTGPPKPLPDGIVPKSEPIADLCTAPAGGSVPPTCMPGGLGGSFDVANLATRPHRVVKSSFAIALTRPPPEAAAPAASGLPRVK